MRGESDSAVTQGRPGRIGASDLAAIFLRSLSIHSSWNFSRMQNIGFAFTLGPIVRRLGKSEEKRREILTRHVAFFNSHPYFSAPIVGSVVKLEEACGEGEDCQRAVDMKATLMSPYAAVGDPFFWGAMKPLAAIMGVLMVFKGVVLAPLLVLVLYNAVHIWFRIRGFIEGYRDGKGAFEYIGSMKMADKIRKIKWVAVAALAVLSSVVVEGLPFSAVDTAGIGARLLMVPVILACVLMMRKGVSVLTLLYGSMCFVLVFSLLQVSGGF